MTDPSAAGDFAAFEYVPGDRMSGLLLICDHAARAIPAHYNGLGMTAEQMERHIAYDIGARALTLGLAERLKVPAVLSTFSRLLIDPNRGADDPTLVMRISDGALVPGNARADAAEVERRRTLYYEPYHRRVADELEAIERARGGRAAFIFSIHSFTPVWRGTLRPWQAAILWDCDPRMPEPIIRRLREDGSLTIGDNEPYDGALMNDCLFRHGTSEGRAHALLEVRQDLIGDEAGVADWVERLHPVLREEMHNPLLDTHRFYPSRTGAACRGPDGSAGTDRERQRKEMEKQ